MSGLGFPIGTECWVSFAEEAKYIGMPVTVVAEPFIWAAGGNAPDGERMNSQQQWCNGWVVQEIRGPTGHVAPYPVKWLRKKGEDPDAALEHESREIEA